MVNEFRKSVNIRQSYGQESSVLFLTHGVDAATTVKYKKLSYRWQTARRLSRFAFQVKKNKNNKIIKNKT